MNSTSFAVSVRAVVRRAIEFSGFDLGVVFGSAARIWSMLTGLVTILLIATFFSPDVQGFHYTFLSLVSIQVFFELGLTQVLIQFAAHEWASLRFSATGHIEGDPVAQSRLASLARFVGKWFAVAGGLFFIGVLAAGWFAFHDAKAQVAWQFPWLTLCVVVAVDLGTLPLWSLLEGCNQIQSVYGLRFVRAVVASIVCWGVIVLHGALWALPISTAVAFLVSSGLLLYRHGRFFESLLRTEPSGSNVISWRHELWPMQWRIAVSWLSGYFYFALFVPLLFKFHGPIPAGQMGMTLNIITSMSGVAGMFIQTKVPRFGMLIAQRRWGELDSLAFRVGLSSVLVTALGALAIFSVVIWLNVSGLALAHRLLPPLPLSIFLIATVLSQVTTPMSTYLRAHKREPLMWISLASGLVVGMTVAVFGWYWGAFGMSWAYLAVTMFFSVPAVFWMFLRCRAAWHL